MIKGKDKEETIRLTAQVLGISADEAGFIYAIETGEIPPTGDVRTVGDMDGDKRDKPYIPLRKVKP